MQVGNVQLGGLAHQLCMGGLRVFIRGVVEGVAGVQAQAHAVNPNRITHGSHTFHRKARTAGSVAAVFVGALVGAGVQKLQAQIATGAVQLYAVKTRIHSALGGCGVLGNGFAHFISAQSVRHIKVLHASGIGPDLALRLNGRR